MVQVLRIAAAIAVWFLSIPAIAQPAGQDESGWTVMTASPDTRIVYVSTAGNDSNSGLSPSAPLRTLAAGYAKLRNGFPDWLLLKTGETWTNARFFWDKSGRSPTEPMVLGSYGDGPRPVLLTGAGSAFTSAQSNLRIDGLHMTPGPGITVSDEVQPLGIVMITGAGPMGNILIEDCRIEGFFKGVVVDWFNGARPFNYSLRRTVIADCYSTGFLHPVGAYFGGVNGLLIEECMFDHNGWRENIAGATPSIFRRNLYIQENCVSVVLRGNILARSAAEGVQLRGGGVVDGNVCFRNGVSSIFVAGIAQVRNNVVIDSRDLDAQNPRGTGIDASQMTSGAVKGNICAYRTGPASAYGLWGIRAASQASTGFIACHDNLVYNWEVGPNAGCAYIIGPTVSFFRNKAVQPAGGTLVDCWIVAPATLRDNQYWSTTNAPFFLDATAQSLAWFQWRLWSGELGSTYQSSLVLEQPPTVSGYASSIGAMPTLEGLLAACRTQSRRTWRDDLTATRIAEYFRTGFGHNPAMPCSGDFDGNGVVGVNDLFMFLNAFSSGQMSADINVDGQLNILDYYAMQTRVIQGCD
jgi:hypothetical protein